MKSGITIHELKIEGYTEPVDISGYILDRYVYAFLSEGEALADIDGMNYLIGPGQLIIVPESKRILLKHYNSCHGYMGSFSISFLKEYLGGKLSEFLICLEIISFFPLT